LRTSGRLSMTVVIGPLFSTVIGIILLRFVLRQLLLAALKGHSSDESPNQRRSRRRFGMS
jgi:hypothetical protein